jgi:hypothetical protein
VAQFNLVKLIRFNRRRHSDAYAIRIGRSLYSAVSTYDQIRLNVAQISCQNIYQSYIAVPGGQIAPRDTFIHDKYLV